MAYGPLGGLGLRGCKALPLIGIGIGDLRPKVEGII